MSGDAFEGLRLDGNVIIITGAGSGIGRVAALLVAARGASVVVADRAVEGGEQTVALICANGGTAAFAECDVSNEGDVRSMVDLAVSRFGRLDGAVNNAGVPGAYKTITEMSLEQWQRAIDINLTGTFLCLKYQLAAMLPAGRGSIVNIASGAGVVGVPSLPGYVASKHGVIGLTRSAAVDYSAKGIRINAIMPGAVDTPMLHDNARSSSEPQTADASRRPIGRFGTGMEIAEAIAWLLSPGASYATGGTFAIDGGYTCI